MVDYIWLIILLPLAGAAFNHFFGRRLGEPLSGWVATVLVGAAFVIGAVATVDFVTADLSSEHVFLFDWLPSVGAPASLLWDPLSAFMTLIITGVGALIHLYAVGYMHGDERFSRFFTYLNLFIGSMLILVLADNFGLLFVGWELVGMCSYLLVSFWFTRPTAAAAGKKAFVVNRVGDFGFLVALMLIFAAFGTLEFETVLEGPGLVISTAMATAITLLLVMGATGKSAQIPLYIWLPDAMEGPTPVSALIHAATMVTAGVYMVARTAALFELAPFSSGLVATIGAVTALFAASIALMQRDIKRVLAYSTISQLGYMFLAVGSGAYVAGIFHLFTHAFFKALLFLAAGAVIHALASRQDMADMGGLRKVMPITAATSFVALLAIIGIPPFAGFWSKDETLAVVFNQGGWWVVLWAIGIITAFLTAVYMTRWFLLVFTGDKRWESELAPHEAPPIMTVPLVLLAVGTAFAGLINTPFRAGLEHFLEPVFEGVELAELPAGGTQVPLAIVSVGVAILGAVYAYSRYRGAEAYSKAPWLPKRQGVWRWVENGYYVDDIIGNLIVLPGKMAAAFAAVVFDQEIIDGAVNAVGAGVRKVGSWLRPLQTGFVRNYGVGLLAGVVGLLIWFVSQGGG